MKLRVLWCRLTRRRGRCLICGMPVDECPRQRFRESEHLRSLATRLHDVPPQLAHLRNPDGSVRREGFVVLRGVQDQPTEGSTDE